MSYHTQDVMELGTPLVPAAQKFLPEEWVTDDFPFSYAKCSDIQWVTGFLAKTYGPGWKPNELATPEFGDLPGMYYCCHRHRQSNQACDCVPTCLGCGLKMCLRIYTRPTLKPIANKNGEAQDSISNGDHMHDTHVSKLQSGMCVQTLTPTFYCPRWYPGNELNYPLIGPFNQDSKSSCPAMEPDANNDLKTFKYKTHFASAHVAKVLIKLGATSVQKPKLAKGSGAKFFERNTTRLILAYMLMARTFRSHQFGFDLDNPQRGTFNPFESLEQTFGPTRTPAVSKESEAQIAELMSALL